MTEIESGLLVGHDGSAASGAAVTWAAQLADRLDVPLHVLRAWSITTAPKPATMEGGYIPPLEDFEQAVVDQLRADLDALGLPTGLEVHCHARHDRSTTALLEAAERVEMLVVGSRGAGGFRGLGFGSTADQVVRHSTRPVVVVPTAS